MGTNSDAPTATVYGNFKCPDTRGFVFGNLEAIIEEFVVPGRLNLEFYNLAYEPGSTSDHFISDSDPRIAAVGTAVWDEDSDSYWQFHHDTFADPPTGYVDHDELASRARDADVSNVDALVDRAEDGEYDGDVEQVAASADDDGISFTPQMELAGDTAAPHHETQSILDWIEERIGEAPAEPAEEEESEADAEEEESEADAEEEEAEESEDDAADEEPESDVEDDAEPEDDVEDEVDEEDEGSDAEAELEEDEVEDDDSEPETEPDDEPSDDETDEAPAEEPTDADDDESSESAEESDVPDDCPY